MALQTTKACTLAPQTIKTFEKCSFGRNFPIQIIKKKKKKKLKKKNKKKKNLKKKMVLVVWGVRVQVLIV
jgi:DNA topoisomerase IB